jgi:hypothetical protein
LIVDPQIQTPLVMQKVRYGMLLGALHGMVYLRERLPEEYQAKIDEVYQDVYSYANQELDHIVRDLFEAGLGTTKPGLDEIVDDSFLNDLMPVEPEE